MDDDEAVLLGGRSHHYEFAHRVLPGWFFGDPSGTLDRLSRGDGPAFLRAAWDVLGEDFGPGEAQPPTGLACHVRGLADGLALVVVTLPPPRCVPEAYFVAGVLPWSLPGPAARVCTLELTVPLSAEFEHLHPKGRAVLCEWGVGGVHMNLGERLPPSADAFCDAVLRRCSARL